MYALEENSMLCTYNIDMFLGGGGIDTIAKPVANYSSA